MLSDLSGVMHSKITRGGGNDCKRWISHQIQNLIYHTKSENANIYDPPSLLFCFRGCASSTFPYHDWIFMKAKSLEYVWRHNVMKSSTIKVQCKIYHPPASTRRGSDQSSIWQRFYFSCFCQCAYVYLYIWSSRFLQFSHINPLASYP
jgi:hypothetical protein